MDFMADWDWGTIKNHLRQINDERVFVIAEALRRGIACVDEIHEITKIDKWFLRKIKSITDVENLLEQMPLSDDLLRRAKDVGLADRSIAEITERTVDEIRRQRKKAGILPCYKMVDTCAAEFEAATPITIPPSMRRRMRYRPPIPARLLSLAPGRSALARE